MSSFSQNDFLVAELLSLGVTVEPAHNEFGVVLSPNTNAPAFKDLPLQEGWLRPLVERYGLVVIKGQSRLIENEASDFVPTMKRVFANPSRDCVEDIAVLKRSPEVQVLGSPNSRSHPQATFIPASPKQTPDSRRSWIEDGIPCAVTDWHSDEPWETNSPTFTCALCAESTGPNATMFSSTAALYKRTDNNIKRRLEGIKTLFVPPPWLASEEGKQARHATVQQASAHTSSTFLDNSFYLCMDSTGGIDGMEDDEAKEIVWKLTEDCMKPEHVYSHQWTRGDLLIWDDTRTLHARTPYAQNSVDRVLYRMRVLGKDVECHGEALGLVYEDPKITASPFGPLEIPGSKGMRFPTTTRSSLEVGIIGGGPAGLMAARMLSLDGHSVTVYEAKATCTHGSNLSFDSPSDELMKRILSMDMQGFAPFHKMRFFGPSGSSDLLQTVARNGWRVLRTDLIERLLPNENNPPEMILTELEDGCSAASDVPSLDKSHSDSTDSDPDSTDSSSEDIVAPLSSVTAIGPPGSYVLENSTNASVVENVANGKVVLEVSSKVNGKAKKRKEFDFCIAADGGNSSIRRTIFGDPVACSCEEGYYEMHGIARCPAKYIPSEEIQFFLAPQQDGRYPVMLALTPSSSGLVSWFACAYSNTELKKDQQQDPVKMMHWARQVMEDNFTAPDVAFISKIIMEPVGDLAEPILDPDGADFGTSWIYLSRMWSMEGGLPTLIKNNVFLVGDAAHKFLPHTGGNLSLVLLMLDDLRSQINAKLETRKNGTGAGILLESMIDQSTMLAKIEEVVDAREVAESRLEALNSKLCSKA